MIESDPSGDTYLLRYGDHSIPFRIEYRERKRLAISVHPDQRLEILAPFGSETATVLNRVEKRKNWITKQIEYFGRFKPKRPDPSYVSGESVKYLGRQYRLKVREGLPENVKLIGRYLEVVVRDENDQDRKQHLVEAWYRNHAKKLFRERLMMCQRDSASLRTTTVPKIAIRKMPSRWGSCSITGNINLNPELIKAPIQCIDYVIVHELCHRIIHDHSPAFYRLLSQSLPDWKARKSRLEACFE